MRLLFFNKHVWNTPPLSIYLTSSYPLLFSVLFKWWESYGLFVKYIGFCWYNFLIEKYLLIRIFYLVQLLDVTILLLSKLCLQEIIAFLEKRYTLLLYKVNCRLRFSCIIYAYLTFRSIRLIYLWNYRYLLMKYSHITSLQGFLSFPNYFA